MNADELSPRNLLLQQLDSAVLGSVAPLLEPVDYVVGDVLSDLQAPLTHVHFPENGVISVMASYANGDTIEMATIGREGVVGIEGSLGAQQSIARYYAQVKGHGHRMPREMLVTLLDRAPEFRQVLFNYIQAFINQLLISGACNGKHPVQARLARWLLTMEDRSDGPSLALTHSFLAEMLGAYRPTVSLALAQLQSAGLIEMRRAMIVIRERAALEAVACECYALSKNAYARLLRVKAESPEI
jgi:CRP-like cAMP-binding protein